MGSYSLVAYLGTWRKSSFTLVASGKLRLTLRGPRFRGRYLAFGRVWHPSNWQGWIWMDLWLHCRTISSAKSTYANW